LVCFGAFFAHYQAQGDTPKPQEKKKGPDPVVYFVPHADDEVLTYAVDIRNAIYNGHPVYLVLFSEGEHSIAREVINGRFDASSVHAERAGERVFCKWHKTYHNTRRTPSLYGHLSLKEFGKVRVDDFYRSGEALGVPKENIFTYSIPNGGFTEQNVRPIIEHFLNQFPNAEFRTMSKVDVHPDHAKIGEVLEKMERENLIRPSKSRYFISIFTDRFSHRPLPVKTDLMHLEDPLDKYYVLESAEVYKTYQPAEGLYGTGYHSVPEQFESLIQAVYTRYYDEWQPLNQQTAPHHLPKHPPGQPVQEDPTKTDPTETEAPSSGE
jgi:N-acetylmuramoyl-L-alanine amidase